MKTNLNTTILSLRDIPGALFNEFRNLRTTLQEKSFHDSCGHPYSVKICFADKSGENGPLTLVHHSSHMGRGRFCRESLMVFNYPVDMSVFEPDYDGWHAPTDWKVNITFETSDPPYSPNSSSGLWEAGKGFWIDHFFGAQCGSNGHGPVSIISNFGDWEFAFMLGIQGRALDLAKGIACRGHWQAEWYPEGSYLERPNVS